MEQGFKGVRVARFIKLGQVHGRADDVGGLVTRTGNRGRLIVLGIPSYIRQIQGAGKRRNTQMRLVQVQGKRL